MTDTTEAEALLQDLPEAHTADASRRVTEPAALTAKGQKTRADLIEAALTLIIERGYHKTRISDIAKLSGTSYGVFYHYFSSKQAIVSELFEVMKSDLLASSALDASWPADPIARIEWANRQYLSAVRTHAPLLAILEEFAISDEFFRGIKLSLREPFVRRNASAIRRLQAQGLAARDLDPETAATILGGMVEHLSVLWFVHGVEFDEETAVSTLNRLWARSLAPQ